MTSYVNPTTRLGGVVQIVVPERPIKPEVDDAPFDDEQYIRLNGEWVPYNAPPIIPDTTPPAEPTDLAASASVIPGEGSVDYSLSWTAPTTNADTTPLTDFAYYVVRWRYAGSGSWTSYVSNDEEFLLPRVTLGANIEWGVLARDTTGNDSDWATSTITGAIDTVAPDQPSTPIVSSRLGTITATWDGEDAGGGPPPADFDRLEIFVSTSSGGPWTQVGSLTGVGSVIISDVPIGETRFVSTVAVDASGNTSTRSAVSSVVVLGVTAADLETDSVTGDELAEGSVTDVHLAPEAFSSSRMRTRQFAGDGTTATTTSATGDVMGAAGAEGTFVAPVSGIVEVTVMAELGSSVAGSAAICSFEVREGTTIGSGTVVDAASATKGALTTGDQEVRSSMSYLVTGLVSGLNYNIRTLLFSDGTNTASAAWARLHIRPSF